jgi:hypothetical protein
MEPYAGVYYNLTLCRLQSRLQYTYHGQPYARVDLNPMPESSLKLCQSRLYPPVRDFGFGLRGHSQSDRESPAAIYIPFITMSRRHGVMLGVGRQPAAMVQHNRSHPLANVNLSYTEFNHSPSG